MGYVGRPKGHPLERKKQYYFCIAQQYELQATKLLRNKSIGDKAKELFITWVRERTPDVEQQQEHPFIKEQQQQEQERDKEEKLLSKIQQQRLDLELKEVILRSHIDITNKKIDATAQKIKEWRMKNEAKH